jgi:hypothetical protein
MDLCRSDFEARCVDRRCRLTIAGDRSSAGGK